MAEGDSTTTSVAGTVPIVTTAPAAKFAPEICMLVPPIKGPSDGMTAETTGGCPPGPDGDPPQRVISVRASAAAATARQPGKRRGEIRSTV